MYLATDAWEILMPQFQEFSEFEALPRLRYHDSWFESDREFLSKHGDVRIGRGESSRSSTTEIPDDAQPMTVSGLTMIRAERQRDQH